MLYYSSLGALAQLGAHNTGSVGVRGSNPLCSTNLWVQKRCIWKNRGFPRFFSFLLRFPRVFENRFFVKLKRCKCGFCLYVKDLNLGIPFLGAELRDFFSRFCPFFVFLIVNSLCLKKEGEVISVTYSKKKIATANTACITVTENAKQAIAAVWKTRSGRDPPSVILPTKKNTKKG